MRHLHRITQLALFLSLTTAAYGQQWTLPGQNIHASLWINDTNLVMVGEKGTILSSSDAGQTFYQHPHLTMEVLRSIATNSGSEILVVGGSTVLQSTNNGSTWQRVDLGAGRSYSAVISLSEDEWGLFFNQDNKLYIVSVTTEDLKPIDTTVFNSTSPIWLAAVSEAIDGSILAMTVHPDRKNGSDVYISEDRGNSWQLLSHLNHSVRDFAVVDSTIYAITSGVGVSAFIYFSTDGGRSWDSTTAPSDAGLDIKGVGTDGENLFVTAEDIEGGYVWRFDRTNNQLFPAQEQIIPGFMLLNKIHFSDLGHSAIITGTQGSIIRLGEDNVWRDRSRSMFNTIASTNHFLKAETFGAGGAAIIGVDIFALRGMALHTFDTATTFGPHPYFAGLNDITRLDDILVTNLVGRHGQIYTSNDSGRSWDLNSTQLTPDYTYVNSQSVASTGSSELFVTADTLLYSSADRGASWQIVKTFSPAVAIEDLDFSPDGLGHLIETDIEINEAMESLYSRVIHLSRDGGFTWDSLFSYTAPANQIANLKVDFPSSEIGIAGFGTFTHTTLVRTVNGGVTWDTVAEIDGGIRDIQMFNEQVGIAVGGDRGGLVLLTRDGGRTWGRPDNIPLSDTTFFDLRFASLFPDGHTLLIGGAGIFLKGSFAESVLSVRTTDPHINARRSDIRLFSHPVRNNVLRGSLGGFEPGTAHYDVTRIDGKAVLSGTVVIQSDANFTIDLQNSEIPAGSYVLSLHRNGEVAEAMFLIVE